ncbi:hypothetical protein Tco_0038273 [Tanacetum coccineum]
MLRVLVIRIDGVTLYRSMPSLQHMERNLDMLAVGYDGRDDNKRTRAGNAFATIANLVGRENMGAWPKCTTCNSYHAPEGPCRTCFNCNLHVILHGIVELCLGM